MKKTCWFLTVIFSSFLTVNAQSPNVVTEQQRQIAIDKARNEQQVQDSFNNLDRLKQESLSSQHAALIRARQPKFEKMTPEEEAAFKKILSPNPEDLTRYKAFLQQPKTGLFRLFPDLDCVSKGVVRADGGCGEIIPGTWFYSFRQKNYSNQAFFDIHLKNENFIANGFLLQGIITRLGDIPMETVSLTASGMKFLTDFKPETQHSEVKKQYSQIAKGIESDGFKYSNNIKASENTTYAMRLIAYRNQNKVADNLSTADLQDHEMMKQVFVNYDKRIDIIIAFRVVRKDENGNLTILWKELSRQDSPKIVFEKNEKLSDIK